VVRDFPPQCEIVSNLAEYYGVKCYVVMPLGEDTKITSVIKNNLNTMLLQPYSRGGYQNVLSSYCKKFAQKTNSYLIPFGMQTIKNVKLIAKECENIPKEVKRIIVPVGSGMTYCGILQGLVDFNRYDVELVGVITGVIQQK